MQIDERDKKAVERIESMLDAEELEQFRRYGMCWVKHEIVMDGRPSPVILEIGATMSHRLLCRRDMDGMYFYCSGCIEQNYHHFPEDSGITDWDFELSVLLFYKSGPQWFRVHYNPTTLKNSVSYTTMELFIKSRKPMPLPPESYFTRNQAA